MDEIILIDKPSGWTSHDVVAKVRSILGNQAGKKVKVGHAGTLDPFATGLLVLLAGSYTKKADEFLKLDKTYAATLRLGSTSTTGDPEGDITPVSERIPTKTEVDKILNKFVGQVMQTPPAFSAIKVNGQRAYKLARKGQQVTLEPRRVTIYRIDKVRCEYPDLSFDVSVSSGTYIRSLAEDIGKALGVGAYLTALRRTRIGQYSIEEAQTIDKYA